MNLHEYQGKELLSSYGLPVLEGRLCLTPEEAEKAAKDLGGDTWAVKAQVHAGGRGKAGGVKIASSLAEVRQHAKAILGLTLVTPQTGPEGTLVRKIYVEAGCRIEEEFYLGLVLDRSQKCLSLVASAEGGMEIEEVASRSPEKILVSSIDPQTGLQKQQCKKIAAGLNLNSQQTKLLAPLLLNLYQALIEKDLSLLEINPLVWSAEGQFYILDAKCSVDDSALFRQEDLERFIDPDEIDPKEQQADKFGLNYISLDGTIGCMVNGAGLAMATMDIIKHYGGEPANFLDVGGGASKEAVTEAFKILLADKKVKGILVNIFGGIMRCDSIASGIVEAAKELEIAVPLVVRLQGTNVELGKQILAESGLKIIAAVTMEDAAEKAVSAVKLDRNCKSIEL